MTWDEEILASPDAIKSMAKLFAKIATTGRGSNICLEEGFLPVPVHFYSPIPDLKDLAERRVWDRKSSLPGIDFQPSAQVKRLTLFGEMYGRECNWSPGLTSDPSDFFTENNSFSFGCAASTHVIIRHFKPKLVLEIGSGMSSRVIRQALAQNAQSGDSGRHLVIDPYPSEFIESRFATDIVKTRVELLPQDFFERLQANDILFIDSGHSVRIGGDVNYLYLEILPRLAPGVMIHVHDINLPYEYPRVYAVNESFRQFWTEQYLLQSFLSFNSEFEILLAMAFLYTDHYDVFCRAFPAYDQTVHRLTPSSFWLRRKSPRKLINLKKPSYSPAMYKMEVEDADDYLSTFDPVELDGAETPTPHAPARCARVSRDL